MTSRLRDLPVGDRYRRAELHFTRGMYSLAREEFESLQRGGVEPPVWRAEISWHLAVCCAALGHSADADRTIEQALRIPGIPRKHVARLESVRGFSAFSRGDYPLAREICHRTAETLRGLGDHRGLTAALRWLALTHLRLGELEPAFECAYCALAEARHADLECEAGHAHAALCVAFIQRGQYDAATSHGQEALGIATRLGHQSGIIRNNIQLSVAARLGGDLETASRRALRALAGAEESDAVNLAISARLAAGRALRETGRLEAARELVQGALELAKTSERERDHVLVLEDLGDLDFAAGNVRAALEKFRNAWRSAEKIAAEGDLIAELGWRIGAALLELGDAEGAINWIERSIAVAEKAGERKEKALALRTRALWNAQGGRSEPARSDLRESLDLLESLNVPYELARTHVVFDRVLSECGADSAPVRAERRHHLAVARRTFERIGATHDLATTEESEIRLVSEEGGPPGPQTSRGNRGARTLEADWRSWAFRQTLDECRKLGPTNLPLLLVGETGTGKTLLADVLHQLGRGADGDCFPVNCAAMPQPLQESELFGHRKGAFTGAEQEHPGLLREAGRGTVFLDEIDKSSLEFQAKLLDVLDAHEVRPVGSTRRVAVEARIICATNRDLFALVKEGKFLEDLHHRLTCGIIQVPALRDRVEDLPALCEALLEEIGTLENTATPVITDDGWRVLTGHHWPGNVRELKSLLHRAVALNRGEPLDAAALLSSAPLGSTLRGARREAPSAGMALSERMALAEKDEILRALEQAGGVRRKAAEILGISYRGLGKKMVRLGLTTASASGRKRS